MASPRRKKRNDGKLRFKAVRVAAVLLLLSVSCEGLAPPRLPLHLRRTGTGLRQQQVASREWMGRRKAAGERDWLLWRSCLQMRDRVTVLCTPSPSFHLSVKSARARVYTHRLTVKCGMYEREGTKSGNRISYHMSLVQQCNPRFPTLGVGRLSEVHPCLPDHIEW